MDYPSFSSATAVASYLAQHPIDIICCRSELAPLKKVSAQRQQWYAQNNHAHQHREILIPLDGSSIYGYGSTFYEAYPGRAFFIDGGENHEVLYPEQIQPVQHLWLSMLAEHATAYVYTTHPDQGQPHVKRRILIRYASLGINPDRLWQSDNTNSPDIYCASLRIIAEAFLLSWFHYAEDHHQQTDSSDHQQRMVNAVKLHIDKTAGYEASLSRMAELAGYSKFHFLRLFKQYADCTLQEYIDSSRQSRVKEMLGSGHSHKDIAAALGFSGAQAFSRWKRKHLP